MTDNASSSTKTGFTGTASVPYIFRRLILTFTNCFRTEQCSSLFRMFQRPAEHACLSASHFSTTATPRAVRKGTLGLRCPRCHESAVLSPSLSLPPSPSIAHKRNEPRNERVITRANLDSSLFFGGGEQARQMLPVTPRRSERKSERNSQQLRHHDLNPI